MTDEPGNAPKTAVTRLVFALLLVFVFGCGKPERMNTNREGSETRPTALTMTDALEIVENYIKEQNGEPSSFKLDAFQTDGKWSVCAWTITGRDSDGNAQFMPGGFEEYYLDELGNITMIAGGK